MRLSTRTVPLMLALGLAAAGCRPAGESDPKPSAGDPAATAPAATDLYVVSVPGMH